MYFNSSLDFKISDMCILRLRLFLSMGFGLLSIVFLDAQSKIDFTIMLDGVAREFIVSKPSGQVPQGGFPVVFMFHGTSGTGLQFYNTSGWKEKGQTENFISVFPTSLKYCILNFPENKPSLLTRWNTGDLQEDKCPGYQQVFKDDVKFVRTILDTLRKNYSVDNRRIYAAGFSNGSSMIHKLAVEASEIFAAVAGVASVLQPLDSVGAKKSVKLWNIVGTSDERFTSVFNVKELPFTGDSILQLMGSYLTRVQTCIGLSNEFNKSTTPTTVSYRFSTSLVPNMQSSFIFSLVKGMEHVYPNGTNFPLNVTPLFWDFFSQNVQTNNVEVETDLVDVTIFPNPSTGVININFEKLKDLNCTHLNILNSNGANIGKYIITHKTEMQIENLSFGSGIYYVQIMSDRKPLFTKPFLLSK